jgi:DNA-binding winged helix-turn-helix (wHTH) protein/tetratricopeptide (TPR) repeat protein
MRLTRYRFGDFQLDPATRELTRSGERLALPLKSLECLVYLVVNRERAVGRDELVSAVWGRADVSDTVITQTMRRARKALDDAGDRQAMIRTVAGFGYRWVADVEEVGSAGPSVEPAVLVESPAPAAEPAPAPAPEPAPEHSRSSRSRVAIAILIVVACGMIAGAAWWIAQQRTAPAQTQAVNDGQAMVLPVTVQPPVAEFSWVRLGAMEYAADRLRSAALKVVPTEQTLHLSNAPTGDAQALQELRARSGAQWLIVPSAEHVDRRWRVRLQVLDGTSDTSVEALGDTPLQAMAAATDTWLRRVRRSPSNGAIPTAMQERLQRIDAQLDAGQLEAAREQIHALPPAQRNAPAVMVREGQLDYRAGQMASAQVLFQRALANGLDTDAATRAKGLMGLGSVALRQRHAEQAQRYYTDALALLGGSGSDEKYTTLLGNAYNGRGVSRVRQDDLAGAVSDFGMARVAMRESGDVVSAAMVGSNLGRIEGTRNHWPQAIQEFDDAIAVFERFQVNDYLAATLAARSLGELEIVQPARAGRSIARASALADTIEDETLVGVILSARAAVATANGALQDASTALKSTSAATIDSEVMAQLRMGLAIARGDRTTAARLAGELPGSLKGVSADTLAIATQAAGSVDVARRWLALDASASHPSAPPTRRPAALFAAAVVGHRFDKPEAALELAVAAVEAANRDGSPNDRVRANVLRALILAGQGNLQEASAVLGELDAYAQDDYRVAWLTWRIYTLRGEVELAQRARLQAESLRKERALDAQPLL